MESGLRDDWDDFGKRVFVNPPFRDIMPWIESAADASRCCLVVVMVLPAELTTGWARRVLETSDTIYMLDKRVKFEDPEGKGRSSPAGGTMIAVWEQRQADIKTWRVGDE